MVDTTNSSLQMSFGDLTIDLERYQVRVRGRALILPYREYALLAYLAGRAGQVVSRRRLLEEGLGSHDPSALRRVDEHVRHLKGILEREGQFVLSAEEPVGYRFAPSKA
jgi:DNA-binding response OmpR family regulator